MNKIEKIKSIVDIVDLATKYNCQPYGSGKTIKTKLNGLRSEKTSSLFLYPESNTWADFGGIKSGGDVIDFVCQAEVIDVFNAMLVLERMYNIDTDETYTPTPRTVNIPEKDYIKPEKVLNAFNVLFEKINKTNHQCLESIIPTYLLEECSDDDKIEFFNLVKYDKQEDTAVVLLPNYKGVAHTFRYRYKLIDDVKKKWVAHFNTKSNYAYCRLNENRLTLIVEGSRDYLSALLCGYSVIALPSAGFKLDNELLKDRLCIFIDDDDGKNSMNDLYENAICEKIFFNHKNFKEITKCNSKDFTDYLYQFKDLHTFKNTFEKFIYSVENNVKSWQDDLVHSKTLLSIDTLLNAPEAEWLIDNFILKQTVTVLHSKAGSGKSTLILSLLKTMIKENTIDNFIYFDADNPLTILKNRLTKLIDVFGDKMIYHTHTLSSADMLKDEMKRICLYSGQGTKSLIVIDTLGKFVTNVSEDREVKPMLDLACELRDKFGATVIIVHHSNKATNEDGDVVFRGSSTIVGDIDFMWGLQRKGKKITIKNDKGRMEYFEKIIADVDLNTYDVVLKGSYEMDEINEANANEEYVESIDMNVTNIKQFIGKRQVDLKELKANFATSKKGTEVSNFLKSYLGRHWDKKDGDNQYNPIYFLVNKEPIVTRFDDDILIDVPDF